MPEYKYKVFVNARFDVVWQKLLDKILHPDKYVQGISHVEILENEKLIVHDKTTGYIVYRLIDHPFFEGDTINICRTTNQIYQSELEYQINWKLKNENNHETINDQDLAQQALQLAVHEMKTISEEAEAVYK